MSILVYLENAGGKFKKPAFEAASYAVELGKSLGLPVTGVTIGSIDGSEIQAVAKYGITEVIHVNGAGLDKFVEQAYGSALAEAIKAVNPKFVVLPQTYSTRAFGPRLSVKFKAGYLSGITSLVYEGNKGYHAKRIANSGKSIEEVSAATPVIIVSVKANGYGLKENPVGSVSVKSHEYAASTNDLRLKPVAIEKASDKISLTEADVVVSAGRGMGSPDNWGSVEELAELLGAATACSKPVADIHWRPHHEHVGQTGIQIAPNFYFAFGISGAIQHLAGVNQSKTILVVNKDKDAPFFKAADYGIVGDVNEVVPAIVKAVKAAKGM
jgi:electron transfer flavoprotein alpha subunit